MKSKHLCMLIRRSDNVAIDEEIIAIGHGFSDSHLECDSNIHSHAIYARVRAWIAFEKCHDKISSAHFYVDSCVIEQLD